MELNEEGVFSIPKVSSLPTFEDLPNLPAGSEAIAASAAQLTPADRITYAGELGVLDEGIGTFNETAQQIEGEILNAPTSSTFRDNLLTYSDPGYEAITRAMLARES